MYAGVAVDEIADLARLKSECRILERLLHVTVTEESKVTTICSRTAFTALLSNAGEILKGLDLSLDPYLY